MTITVKQGGAAYPKFGEDESYALDITGDRATLNSNTVVGAMRGMETLLQLVSGGGSGYFFPASQRPGQAPFSVARPDDRRGAALRAG